MPVVRTEHHAQEWQIQFVTHIEALFPKAEVVGGDGRRHQVQGNSGLCRVVGVAHLVDETECTIHETARLQAQMVVEQAPTAVAPPVEVVTGLQFTGGLAAILRIAHVEFVLDDVVPVFLGLHALAYI